MIKPIILSLLLLGVAVPTAVNSASSTVESPLAAAGDTTVNLLPYYDFGIEFDVPTLIKDGITYDSLFIYPDGKSVSSTTVILDQSGIYRIEYTAKHEGQTLKEEYSFIVKNQIYSFTSTKSFASYEKSDRTYNNEGLFVALAADETLTFNTVIDLNLLGPKDPLFQMFVAPESAGTIDFGALTITLTDIADPTEKMDLLARASIEGVDAPYTYWMARGKDQIYAGSEYNHNTGEYKVHKNNDFGSPVHHSFYGRNTGGAPVGNHLLSVSYDRTENIIYPNSGTIKAADFDDPLYFEKMWRGFPSGKVKMTISASSYQNDYAHFVIKDIPQIDLTDPVLEDNEGPVITIDSPYVSAPNAFVGYSYPVFPATANDIVSGECEVTTRVFYIDPNNADVREEVEIVNNRFNIHKEGIFEICYESIDNVANVSQEVIKVIALSEVTPITIAPKETPVSEVKRGTVYKFPQFDVAGGSGELVSEFKVLLNGQPYESEKTRFIPKTLGEYTVSCVVSDITNQTSDYTWTVNVIENDGAVFYDEPTLPKYMLSTYSYQLPALYAVDYGNEEKLALADVEIDYGFYKVTTKAGTNFVAEIDENGGTIGITYKWKDAELHYDVAVLKVYEGIKLNIANYFLTDNTSIDTNFPSFSEFIAVEDGDASWEFANPVLSEGFSMRLSSSDKPSTFKTIEITLTDTSNVEETLTVTLTRGANGVLEYAIPGSGNITGVKYDQYEIPFNVSYSKGKIYLNNADLTVRTYDNGEPFNGFSSQYVYISAKVADAKAGERYRIHKLDNQAICSFASDFIEPRIVLNGEIGGYRDINSIYTISTASFSDVLDPAIISSVEVKDPSGKHVTDVNGLVLNRVRCNRTYNIKLDQYGQYILIYRASDSTGNTLSYTFAVGVLNDVEPEIKITSSYATEIKLGEMIILPEYEVTINGEKPENVNILTYATIKTPSCYIAQLTGKNNSYKPNQVGEYEVTIYAMDDNGNVATFEYVVTVK